MAQDRSRQTVSAHLPCMSTRIHSRSQRNVRDQNLASTPVFLQCHFRKIFCPACQRIVTEDLELLHPYFRVTRRLAEYIHGLCKVMTVKEVAEHLGLDWKTVKNIDISISFSWRPNMGLPVSMAFVFWPLMKSRSVKDTVI